MNEQGKQQMKKLYTFGPNYCDCHPETCCCDKWAIYKPNGEKYVTVYMKATAEDLTEALNKGVINEN